ncbi:LacI family DNA-binding transcriptional regulator [Parafrankia sp. EUN1f]|uniref:LacI family DNA-binding transcriptional regulator n=1 Tax=Parafrankia sp. EUN1f TaxID=102897 RepID=UPI0001C46802|nr:LacI family DNA-binding transcriptional regulator [Parafrankia sp. EUN1f]EFC80999.1 transcriptional regulator, LacI family [Parafrankia sp. EUN1f]
MRRSSPSMNDVAKAAGVSLGTVSNVLNNPAKVADTTRRRVEAAIVRLGFVRNGAARSLSSGTSSTLGFVIIDLSNSFFLDMARGAEREASRAGMNVLLANADMDRGKQHTYLSLFEEERVAGVLLAPEQSSSAETRSLRSRGMPLVVLNDPSVDPAVWAVQTDNVRGGYLAARHLVSLGRRRLLFAGPDHLAVVQQRFQGVQHAVREAGGGVALELTRTDGVRVEDGRRVGDELLECPDQDRPDGVIAGADLLALGLIHALVVDGRLRVPQDVAVVGYDNNRSAWNSVIPITTLDQAGEEMGRAATQMLLSLINGTMSEPQRPVITEPFLVARESTIGR